MVFWFPSPLLGLSVQFNWAICVYDKKSNVSVPSFGVIRSIDRCRPLMKVVLGFRPLFWGYPFNEDYFLSGDEYYKVSVPSFGVIRSIRAATALTVFFRGFRPLFWGYPFNMSISACQCVASPCFRPLFWGYPFNSMSNTTSLCLMEFPSPLLGLSVQYYKQFV